MTNEQEELICEPMRERILSLIAVCGELPANQLKRIPGGERYKQNMIMQLKKENRSKLFTKTDCADTDFFFHPKRCY